MNFSSDDPDYIENWLDKKINKLSSEDRFKFYDLSDARGFDYDEGSYWNFCLFSKEYVQ